MITLEFYTYVNPDPVYIITYRVFFRSDEDLQEMLDRVLNSAKFNQEFGHFTLRAKGSKSLQVYYTDSPTHEMTTLLRDYNLLFRYAYHLAADKVWWFAWKVAGEKYRINCALLQIDKAREKLTTLAWEG